MHSGTLAGEFHEQRSLQSTVALAHRVAKSWVWLSRHKEMITEKMCGLLLNLCLLKFISHEFFSKLSSVKCIEMTEEIQWLAQSLTSNCVQYFFGNSSLRNTRVIINDCTEAVKHSELWWKEIRVSDLGRQILFKCLDGLSKFILSEI